MLNRRSSLLPFGIFFFLLLPFGGLLGLLPYLKRLDALDVKIAYLQGSTDMILDAQNAQHKLLVALVENCD